MDFQTAVERLGFGLAAYLYYDEVSQEIRNSTTFEQFLNITTSCENRGSEGKKAFSVVFGWIIDRITEWNLTIEQCRKFEYVCRQWNLPNNHPTLRRFHEIYSECAAKSGELYDWVYIYWLTGTDESSHTLARGAILQADHGEEANTWELIVAIAEEFKDEAAKTAALRKASMATKAKCQRVKELQSIRRHRHRSATAQRKSK